MYSIRCICPSTTMKLQVFYVEQSFGKNFPIIVLFVQCYVVHSICNILSSFSEPPYSSYYELSPPSTGLHGMGILADHIVAGSTLVCVTANTAGCITEITRYLMLQ